MKIIDNFNGKSGLLLNTVYYAMKYNDNVVMRDPNKRPCVLYISGENDVEETMQRELSYANAVDENGKGLPLEETVEKLREEKLFEGLWEKRILYRPKGSISTGDLDSIINEVEADGTVEVKILIYDYLKRIKPDYPTGDIRLDIGEATNDLSILSKRRKIAVITANQLNREAYRVLHDVSEERSGKNKGKANSRVDLGKRLDQSMISESNMMLENADFVCAINREYSPADGRYYLTFKDLKNRSDKGNSKPTDGYFAHPFEDGNTMRLQEDADLDRSLSFDSIANTLGAVVDDDDFIEDDDDEDSQEEKRTRVMKSRESKKKVLRRNIDTI